MAVGRGDWMVPPNVHSSFKSFEDSFIKAPFSFVNSPHILPEKILDSFVDQAGLRCYRVKWQDTWLPEQHVTNTFPHLVTEYWLSKPIGNEALDFQSNFVHHEKPGSRTVSLAPAIASFSLPQNKARAKASSVTPVSAIASVTAAEVGGAPLRHLSANTADTILPEDSAISRTEQQVALSRAVSLAIAEKQHSPLVAPHEMKKFSNVGESLKLPVAVVEQKSNASEMHVDDSSPQQTVLQLNADAGDEDNSVVVVLQKDNVTVQVSSATVRSAEPTLKTLNSQSGSIMQQYLASSNSFLQAAHPVGAPPDSAKASQARKTVPPKTKRLGNTVTKQDRQPVQCDICFKMISSQKNLRVHKTVKHFKNGNFACEICGRKFALSRDLRRHMPLHTNERNYACPYCGKLCKQPGHLTKHIRVHTEVLNWRCDCCFQTFKVQAELKEHCFSAHADIKDQNMHCSVCKERLKLPNSVYLHSLRHSGVREFFCRICNAGFKLKQHMQVHMRTHDKPDQPEKLTCPICSRDFRHKYAYDKHVSNHSEKTAEEYEEKQKLKRRKVRKGSAKLNPDSDRKDNTEDDEKVSPAPGKSKLKRRATAKTPSYVPESDSEESSDSELEYLAPKSRRKNKMPRQIVKKTALLRTAESTSKKRKTSRKNGVVSPKNAVVEETATEAAIDLLLQCTFCGESFADEPALSLHRKQAHPNEKLDDTNTNALEDSGAHAQGPGELPICQLIVFDESADAAIRSGELDGNGKNEGTELTATGDQPVLAEDGTALTATST